MIGRSRDVPRVAANDPHYAPKPIDPEVDAMRAIVEAMEPLNEQERARVLDYTRARYGHRFEA